MVDSTWSRSLSLLLSLPPSLSPSSSLKRKVAPEMKWLRFDRVNIVVYIYWNNSYLSWISEYKRVLRCTVNWLCQQKSGPEVKTYSVALFWAKILQIQSQRKWFFSKKNKKLNFLRNPEYLNNCLLFFWATKYQLQGGLQNNNATAFPATTLQFDFNTTQPAAVKTKHEIGGICIQCVEATSEVWYQVVWISAGILTFGYIFEIHLDIKSKVCTTQQIFMHTSLFSNDISSE